MTTLTEEYRQIEAWNALHTAQERKGRSQEAAFYLWLCHLNQSDVQVPLKMPPQAENTP